MATPKDCCHARRSSNSRPRRLQRDGIVLLRVGKCLSGRIRRSFYNGIARWRIHYYSLCLFSATGSEALALSALGILRKPTSQ